MSVRLRYWQPIKSKQLHKAHGEKGLFKDYTFGTSNTPPISIHCAHLLMSPRAKLDMQKNAFGAHGK